MEDFFQIGNQMIVAVYPGQRHFRIARYGVDYIIEIMSDDTLMSLYKSYNFLIYFGHHTKEGVDSMYPFERSIFIGLLNKTKEDLEEKYAGWTIDKFSDTQIVISKKEEGECGEHYIVKDKEGKVVIYKLLEDGTEKEYEVTDISTEYITDTDKINMKNGIKVNGKQELNQLIEDFE